MLELTAAAGSRRADAPAAGNGLPEVLLVGERLQRGSMGQVPPQVELPSSSWVQSMVMGSSGLLNLRSAGRYPA
jgi:hypothetical protein